MSVVDQEIEDLKKIGINIITSFTANFSDDYDEVEYCSDSSNMKSRAYYCPFLFFDLQVSNAKRGHIEKTIPHSKDYYKFFKKNREVIRIEKIVGSRCSQTELLYRENNNRFGVSFYSNLSNLYFDVIKENFHDDKLYKVINARFLKDVDNCELYYKCIDIYQETYKYNSCGEIDSYEIMHTYPIQHYTINRNYKINYSDSKKSIWLTLIK